MPTRTFWTEPTDRVRVSLRVFTYSSRELCPKPPKGWDQCGHDASVVIEASAPRAVWEAPSTTFPGAFRTREELIAEDDPRWPTVCDQCGQVFTGERQVRAERLYGGAPGGKLYTLRDLPPGAMYDAWWLPEGFAGADGIRLAVVLPNGWLWMVDDRASNCTLPKDNVHKCWVRHGDPRKANVTVDKNGNTCSAGGGSIRAGDYHGFLRKGVLVPA